MSACSSYLYPVWAAQVLSCTAEPLKSAAPLYAEPTQETEVARQLLRTSSCLAVGHSALIKPTRRRLGKNPSSQCRQILRNITSIDVSFFFHLMGVRLILTTGLGSVYGFFFSVSRE